MIALNIFLSAFESLLKGGIPYLADLFAALANLFSPMV